MRGRDRETGAAAGVAGGNWSPCMLVTTVAPTTFDGCFRWRWGHQVGNRATVVHQRFVLSRTESDSKLRVWLLSRTEAALLSFPLSNFRTERGFRYVRYSSSTGLRTFMILGWTGKKLRVVDTSVPISKLQQHQLHAWLCFARILLHGCMRALASSGCTRVHAVKRPVTLKQNRAILHP